MLNLVVLGDHSFSSPFGTFLSDCEKERCSYSGIHQHQKKYILKLIRTGLFTFIPHWQ